ncbi:PRTRC system protein E [Ralstonia sp. UBA689]|uniref:PRTRC system protein E n=1 Tax=Ralstonia sp. UBA689 TaxID=1947373 RepID=UPI0025DC378F|nr:PRTRC system protein E [Ralstonia sp. UBA689]
MFTEIHALARAASLLISVAAEGDDLRVTINAAPTSKNSSAMHPLVLVGTPEELDAGFAQAIEIFEPSALPLLEQAQAAANANGNKGKGTAKEATKPSTKTDTPAAGTPPKRGPGRPPKSASSNAAEKADTGAAAHGGNTDADEDTGAPAVDPRQMSLVEPAGDSNRTGTEQAHAAQTPQAEQPTDAAPNAPASTDPRDVGIDMPI